MPTNNIQSLIAAWFKANVVALPENKAAMGNLAAAEQSRRLGIILEAMSPEDREKIRLIMEMIRANGLVVEIGAEWPPEILVRVRDRPALAVREFEKWAKFVIRQARESRPNNENIVMDEARQRARHATDEYIKFLDDVRMQSREWADKIKGDLDNINVRTEALFRDGTVAARQVIDLAANTSTELQQRREDIESNLERVEATATAHIERLQHAQDNLTRIGPVISLWKDKAFEHGVALLVSGTLFVGLIVATGVVIFFWGPDYISRMTAVAAGQPIIATSMIVAPVLGVAWVLRIMSRFIIQNLTMREDARQRRAIADTFIRLVAEKGGLSKEERALALNALFRAPVGSGESDVVPPNLLDLITGKKD